MSTKKYISLEEVCARLGMPNEQVNRLRESGQLRGFADRGTWKFKSDDVEEFARSRQADSSPEVPLLDLPMYGDESERSVLSSEFSTEDSAGELPTVIRGSQSVFDEEEPLLSSSDSDVRLILDDHLTGGDSNPDVTIPIDSDSDVRLIDEEVAPRRAPAGSDSDVKLIADEDSSEDVRLLSDSSMSLGSGSDSDVALMMGGGDSVFEDDIPSFAEDSGISLEHIADSGIALDSGETLDSGISLDAELSGPNLGPDSSITLGDSVLLGEDSGISLDVGANTGLDDSGIALEALGGGSSDPMGRTVPMMGGSGIVRDDPDTAFEMSATGDDSEFELSSFDAAEGNDTSVVLFDDEDAVNDPPATAKKSGKPAKKAAAAEFEDEFDAAEGLDDFDAGDGDEFGELDSQEFAGEGDEDLEFEAADEDFEEGFVSGESQQDFTAMPAGTVVAGPEAEFGTPTFVGLAFTSGVLVLCGMMMFDLLRSMWGFNEPMLSTWLLDSTRGIF